MKKRLFVILSVLLIFMLTYAGCGSAAKEDAMDMGGNYSEPEAAPEGEVSTDSSDSSVEVEEGSDALKNRKLIERVNITVQTKEYDSFINNINKAINDYNGYIEYSDVYNDEDYSADRRAYLTIRIPADKLKEFTSLVSDIGTVTSKSTSVEDITLQYVDTQSHIKALRTEEETLLRLLEEAKDLDDVLVLQSRLTEIRYQLESYESQLRTYDNLVTYATVELNVYEVEREVVSGDVETVWDEIGANLSTAVYNIGNFLRGLFVFLVSAIPYLALIAIIVVPILYFCIIRPARKRKKAKEQANDQPKV